jgi:hypothetical protein
VSKSQIKILLITSFDVKATVHFTFIAKGQTVNPAYYVEILKRLREAVRRKMSERLHNDWILHHDNAPAQKALSVKHFLAQKSITEMNTHRSPLILLRLTSGCFTNKVCLKGTNIWGDRRHPKM